jgi:peptidoglycan/xylan/chitin deacetylase (PgdA/CDA1 family)
MKPEWRQCSARPAILAFACVAPLFLVLYFKTNPFLALGVLFVSHVFVLIPTLVANCQWWGPVVTSFATARREVWLTIDDGPDRIHTPQMLELLARFDARATFFVIGERAAQFPEEIAAIRAAGHEIGNHTFSHPSGSFWSFPPDRIAAEIDAVQCATTPYFRSPAGLKNFFVHPALWQRNMLLVGWTVRGLDTVSDDPAAVAERIRGAIKPGAIVLLHEGHRTEREPEFHPRCLELTLSALAQEGYRSVLPSPEQLRPRAGEK